MQITITPTNRFTYRGNTALRIWQGADAEGNPVVVLVEGIARTDVDEQPEMEGLRLVEGNDEPDVTGLEQVPYHRAFEPAAAGAGR